MTILWDKKTNLILPSGVEYTPEEIMSDENFGFVRHVPTVLEQQGPLTVGIDNLFTLMEVYEIPEDTDEKTALRMIIEKKAEQKREQQAAGHATPDSESLAKILEAVTAVLEMREEVAQLKEAVQELQKVR